MTGQLLVLLLGALFVLVAAAPFVWLGILPRESAGGDRRQSPPRAAGRRW